MRAPLRVERSGFDPLGPAVHSSLLRTGRRVRYLDEGSPGWPALVFLGGAGTSVRAFRLVEFARSFREELGLRVVSVERSGLGLTPPRGFYGPDDYAEDVWALLDELGIDTVAVVAISGGGPFAARLLARRPDRATSVHLACAYAERLPGRAAPYDPDPVARDPVAWWTFPPGSAVHRVPGLVDSAVEEATHALLAQGPGAALAAISGEHDVVTNARLPDLSAVTVPVDLYWGEHDGVVPLEQLERWRRALPSIRTTRIYPREGHDVQYRHWDQILCDVRYGGSRIVLTEDGVTTLVDASCAAQALSRGATLGLAGWQAPARCAASPTL